MCMNLQRCPFYFIVTVSVNNLCFDASEMEI